MPALPSTKARSTTQPPDGDGASIDVLMATYNGERFVAEQIESILRQSHPDWKLTVRDDCSTDGTCAVVRDYARRHPDRIVAQQRGENSGSAEQNFFEMLLESTARYVMLCDQDDLWLDDKIALTVGRMAEMEHRFGADTAVLDAHRSHGDGCEPEGDGPIDDAGAAAGRA